MHKPYSESCDQNCWPLLDVLQPRLEAVDSVLEIGSGTGQHGVFFAQQLPHLAWYTSDRQENHAGISMWLEEARLPNLHGPLNLDVLQSEWPDCMVSAVYSANSAHIMDDRMVEAMFAGVGNMLQQGGLFILYGPFNYAGQYTSASNEQFDAWLKSRNPASGIKDFEVVDQLACKAGLGLQDDIEMPANNRTLVWAML